MGGDGGDGGDGSDGGGIGGLGSLGADAGAASDSATGTAGSYGGGQDSDAGSTSSGVAGMAVGGGAASTGESGSTTSGASDNAPGSEDAPSSTSDMGTAALAAIADAQYGMAALSSQYGFAASPFGADLSDPNSPNLGPTAAQIAAAQQGFFGNQQGFFGQQTANLATSQVASLDDPNVPATPNEVVSEEFAQLPPSLEQQLTETLTMIDKALAEPPMAPPTSQNTLTSQDVAITAPPNAQLGPQTAISFTNLGVDPDNPATAQNYPDPENPPVAPQSPISYAAPPATMAIPGTVAPAIPAALTAPQDPTSAVALSPNLTAVPSAIPGTIPGAIAPVPSTFSEAPPAPISQEALNQSTLQGLVNAIPSLSMEEDPNALPAIAVDAPLPGKGVPSSHGNPGHATGHSSLAGINVAQQSEMDSSMQAAQDALAGQSVPGVFGSWGVVAAPQTGGVATLTDAAHAPGVTAQTTQIQSVPPVINLPMHNPVPPTLSPQTLTQPVAQPVVPVPVPVPTQKELDKAKETFQEKMPINPTPLPQPRPDEAKTADQIAKEIGKTINPNPPPQVVAQPAPVPPSIPLPEARPDMAPSPAPVPAFAGQNLGFTPGSNLAGISGGYDPSTGRIIYPAGQAGSSQVATAATPTLNLKGVNPLSIPQSLYPLWWAQNVAA